LNIYNGTSLGVPQDVKGQSLTEIVSLNKLAHLLSNIII